VSASSAVVPKDGSVIDKTHEALFCEGCKSNFDRIVPRFCGQCGAKNHETVIVSCAGCGAAIKTTAGSGAVVGYFELVDVKPILPTCSPR